MKKFLSTPDVRRTRQFFEDLLKQPRDVKIENPNSIMKLQEPGVKVANPNGSYSDSKALEAETPENPVPRNTLSRQTLTLSPVVSSATFDQFTILLDSYQKEPQKRKDIFNQIKVLLLAKDPIADDFSVLNKEEICDRFCQFISYANSSYIKDKCVVYQFIELLLHQFNKDDDHIDLVQLIWKNQLLLRHLLDSEETVSQHSCSDLEQKNHHKVVSTSLKKIKKFLLLLSLDPRFSFEELGKPDRIGIGPYIAPADTISLQTYSEHLKNWLFTSCDSNIFAMIHLRKESGTLSPKTSLAKFHHAFFIKEILSFLEFISNSSNRQATLESIFLKFTDISEITSYKLFKDSLPIFLNDCFKEYDTDSRPIPLSLIYKLEPFKFTSIFLLSSYKIASYQKYFFKIWDKILDRSHRAISHLESLNTYTTDQDTLNYIICLADTFLQTSHFENASEELKDSIKQLNSKFSLDCLNSLTAYVQSLHSKLHFNHRVLFKEAIIDLVESKNLAPLASQTLFLKYFQSCLITLPNKLGPYLSDFSLPSFIPLFVQGFIDALSDSENSDTKPYLIYHLSSMMKISKGTETKHPESLSPSQKECLEILKEMSKLGLPELQLEDTSLASNYDEIKVHFRNISERVSFLK